MEKKIYLMLFVFFFLFGTVGCVNDELKPEQSVKSEEIEQKTNSSEIKKEDNNIQDKKSNKKEKVKTSSKKKRTGKKKNRTVSNDTMVNVAEYIPNIGIDLKYATKENFTGKKIYDFKKAYLRYGTVKKLKKAQETLQKKGLYLNIWDAYRPVKAQFRLWEVCPDSAYVANPNTGYSSHSRGNTVDVTLITIEGKKVNMPTGFDDFTGKADRDFSDCTKEETENAKLLEEVMENFGFKGYSKEWWHFSDTISYSVKKEVKNLK